MAPRLVSVCSSWHRMSPRGSSVYSRALTLVAAAFLSHRSLPALGKEESTMLGHSVSLAMVGHDGSSHKRCRVLARERQQSGLAASGTCVRTAGRLLSKRDNMAQDIGGSAAAAAWNSPLDRAAGRGNEGGAVAGVHLYAVGSRGAAWQSAVAHGLPSGTSLMQLTQDHTACSFIHHCGGMWAAAT